MTTVQETPLVTEPSEQTLDAERPQSDRAAVAARAMIVFETVTKVYEPNVIALEAASFVIEKGEFVFLVGPSGSGKSTMVRLLLKELEPTSGRIVVGGRDLGAPATLEGAAAAPQHRLRLPGLQAAARTARRPRTSPTR